MNTVTHALTMNGRIHGELEDPLDSPEEVLRKRLSLLDGTTRYSLMLWLLPEGVPFDKVNLAAWPREYAQVAGSWQRLTMEIRRLEANVLRQYVVGHTVRSEPSGSKAVIGWNGCETVGHESEIFGGSEAADLFAAYYKTGGIPSTYNCGCWICDEQGALAG